MAEQMKCVFCCTSSKEENTYGKLFVKKGVAVHYFCMLFASGLSQNGDEDQEFSGFLIKDITKEVSRGKRLRCVYCKKTGATIGCCVRSCRMVFHFGCGQPFGALHQFFDTYRSYCPQHRMVQEVPESEWNLEGTCPICISEVVGKPSENVVKSPCCKSSWFHRVCIQQTADSAGLYFFKCPICKNTDEFQTEMLKLGIYIPDQDAKWEREGDFEDLLQRYNRCDSRRCLSRRGRTFNKKNSHWEIVLCDWCGSSGTHIRCHHLKTNLDEWVCSLCRELSNKKGSAKKKSSKSEYQQILQKKKESEYVPSSSTRKRKQCPSKMNRKQKRRKKKTQDSNSSPFLVNGETASTTSYVYNPENENVAKKCRRRPRRTYTKDVAKYWTYVPKGPEPLHSPSKVSPSKILPRRLRSSSTVTTSACHRLFNDNGSDSTYDNIKKKCVFDQTNVAQSTSATSDGQDSDTSSTSCAYLSSFFPTSTIMNWCLSPMNEPCVTPSTSRSNCFKRLCPSGVCLNTPDYIRAVEEKNRKEIPVTVDTVLLNSDDNEASPQPVTISDSSDNDVVAICHCELPSMHQIKGYRSSMKSFHISSEDDDDDDDDDDDGNNDKDIIILKSPSEVTYSDDEDAEDEGNYKLWLDNSMSSNGSTVM